MIFYRICKKLPLAFEAARVGIVRVTGRNGEHAGARDHDLVLAGRGGGELGGGSSASENEDDNDSASNVLHGGIPLRLYLRKKILLDLPTEETIKYVSK